MTGIFRGLQTLWSGIQTIIQGIKMGFQFLWNIIKSIWNLIQLLYTTVGNATNIIATLPSWLIAVATATLGVAVLYMLIGRESGKN